MIRSRLELLFETSLIGNKINFLYEITLGQRRWSLCAVEHQLTRHTFGFLKQQNMIYEMKMSSNRKIQDFGETTHWQPLKCDKTGFLEKTQTTLSQTQQLLGQKSTSDQDMIAEAWAVLAKTKENSIFGTKTRNFLDKTKNTKQFTEPTFGRKKKTF